MATKNRRTKGKNLADDSSDDDTNNVKKIGNISYVKREREKLQKHTKKVLSKICDEDESNSDIEQRFIGARMPLFAERKTKNHSKSDESDSYSNDSDVKLRRILNKNSMTKNVGRSESSSESEFKQKFYSNKKKKDDVCMKRNPFCNILKRKSQNCDKANKSKSQSEASSSEENQRFNLKKDNSKSGIGDHVFDNYSIVTTPCKSDDENILVEDELQNSLKNHVVEEVKKLQQFLSEFNSSLEYQSDYLVKKKIIVVRDSKFIAHKILRIYDSTHAKLQESKNNFANHYRKWLDKCSSSKLTANINKSFKSSKANDISTKKQLNIQKQNSLTLEEKSPSQNSDESEQEIVTQTSCERLKKSNSTKTKLSLSNNSLKNNDISNRKKNVSLNLNDKQENISKDVNKANLEENNESNDEVLMQNKSMTPNTKIIYSLSSNSENESNSLDDKKTSKFRKENSHSEEKSIDSAEENRLTTPKKVLADDNTQVEEDIPAESQENVVQNSESSNEDNKATNCKDKPILESSKSFSCTQNEKLSECDSEGQVSDCDSVNIFSEDGGNSDEKLNKEKDFRKIKVKAIIENNQISKNFVQSSESKTNENNSSASDIFLNSASEVENTPKKSPILNSRNKLRRTLSSKPLNLKNNTVNVSKELKVNDENQHKRKHTSIFDTDTASQINKERSKEAKKLKLKSTDEESDNDNTNKEIAECNPSSDSNKVPGAHEKEEREALNNLLHDCNSDTSIDSMDKKSLHSLNSDKSIDSTCSTILNDKTEEIQEKPAKKLTKSSQHNKNFSMQSKKTNSIYSDSSSDSAEEQPRAKNSCRANDVRLPLRNRQRLSLLRKNLHYKTDKKLRMVCEVSLERLSNTVLKKYTRALDKSKQYVANKKFKSITNLEGLESKKRSRKNLDVSEIFGNDSTTNIKTKKKNNNEKRLSKDLEEENNVQSDEDHSHKVKETKSLPDNVATQNIIDEAEMKAKEALLNSSSNSSNDENTMDVDDDGIKEINKIQTANTNIDTCHTEVSDVISDDENVIEEIEEDGNEDEIIKDGELEKSNWKQDKLLTFEVTDTESEEEQSIKSQEKKKAKNSKEESSKSLEKESSVKSSNPKKRGRKKRRIVDSDSEAKKDSSNEESDAVSQSDEESEKKKKSKKRQKSSDSDTSSSDKKPKSKRKRIKKVASESESDDQDSPGKGRKNIRKVLKDKHVADDTKKAAQDEEERLKRIAERQKLFNEMYDARLAGEAKVDKLVLDFDEETKQELVVVDEELVKRLKPHQAKGIKFMWDACFESLKQIEKSDGSGCIIAHCMGLGKTFQVVTLSHTLLSHEETKVNTVMVVCPLSTVLNWVNEFKTWLKHVKNGDDIEIYELTKSKKNVERKYQLESWQRTGGVLIIGYEMFRNLTSTGKKMRKAMQESIMRSLVDPGADLVVCDEGHLLKNEESALSKAMKLVKTLRRVVLTGTPLQNNLKEYHCMVQFVKPNLLGTKKEFLNRFVNPITNGQFDDSTPYDVKLMKKRAHVLHKMLEGSVQRFDYSVLTPFLPPKQEYVIFVRLTEVQIKMYQHYLDNFARRFGQRNGSLFADFQELQRIWTHPYVLRLNAEKVEKANEKKRLEASDSEGSLKDFIDYGSDSEISDSNSTTPSNSDIECIDSDKERPMKTTRSTRLNPKEELVEEVPNQESVEEAAWWSKFVEEKHFEDLRISTKLILLFGILKESEQIGDKVLVFSQSLYSLTLIEQFLNLIDQETQNSTEAEHLDKHTGSWSLGLDYFRLDGSTSAENRSAWCKIFNTPSNTRARLFLISTRAGGLGINLTAANRVIIFDASWNPSHDVQSIFRIYRFGQKKPCYVYRFLAAGTMEEKIYNRQVTKLSLACRVVDEQQIERHYSNNDLAELYQFDSYDGKSVTLNLPKDRLLAEIFLKYKDAVYTYHEHDSLLENKEEEELDEEERKQAWLEYEEEKQGKRQMINMGNNMGFNQMLMNMNSFPELESIKLLIQKDYPTLPAEHLESVARQAVYDMYRFVDQQAVNQILNPFAAGQTMQSNLLGASAMQMQQQQQFNQQSQLMNMLNPQQLNYPGVNHMPVYSGRGRPPKMSMNHMANMRQMQMPMQMPQGQIPQGQISQGSVPQGQVPQGQVQPIRNNDEVEVISEHITPPTIDLASNINNIKEK